MINSSGEKLDVYKIVHHGYYNCTGNKDYIIQADRYIVSNAIDIKSGAGFYKLSNDEVTINGIVRKACFYRMSFDMCDAYYVSNSTKAIVVNMNKNKVTLTGGGYGRNASSRCN